MALVRARCYVWEIMAVGGHSTLSQVQVYIDEFNREQKAEDAMEKLAAGISSRAWWWRPGRIRGWMIQTCSDYHHQGRPMSDQPHGR